MEIIYPPLVEQSYQFITQQGIKVSKAEVYQMMVQEGMLTQTGEPTKKALEQGIVTEYKQQHRTLKEFKQAYPIFKGYPVKEFTQQDGIWYVSQDVIADIQAILDANNCDVDIFNQINTYFNFRNYDNPHGSIAEIKGVYHPLYTSYDDSMFQFVNGQVAIPKEVMADIIQRCDEGKLDVDRDTVEGFKHLLAQMEQEQ
ncbi:hypothetical protein P7H00_02190 [Enterococcus pseudoavium]|uniref:Uncharacterized protein n=1 Tax=Enterococcus pseudoavium TaxID=44007 RepID=A0AAE4HZT4_9ENTE|nr:hypothetical protein [Enterococcus pseudoavium]MDT2735943.1 hypothetical protein [Enterococcus pseudoavium]